MSGPSVTGWLRIGRRRGARGGCARLALLAPLLLGGCYGHPAPRGGAADYHVGYTQRLYALAFVPGRADPVPEDRAALARLRPALRSDASATLVAGGPLAGERASLVSRALGRPVALDARTPGRPGLDEAVLVLLQPAIVPDACIGAGQPVGRNLWTFDDDRRRLLPAGCATAAMLLEQAADRRDVLRGRRLEPGAAGPIARAADRYLGRNDGRPVREQDRSGTGETSEDQAAGPAQAALPAAGSGVQLPGLQAGPEAQRLPPASTPLAPR